MKSIQNQYNALKEGKMSQHNFMRNLRMTMPQYVTNVTSFGDAVKILKNKGILNESFSNFDEAVVLTKKEYNPEEETTNNDDEFDAILSQIEDEMYGERTTKSDVLDEPLEEFHSGNPNDKYVVKKSNSGWCVWEGDVKVDEFDTEKEAKEFADKKNAAQGLKEAKTPAKAKIQPDENIQEVLTGIAIEHLFYPEESYETIRNTVYKNIKKNPQYYTNMKLTGIRDFEIQTMDSSKPEDHQMKFYTEKTAIDTARGMKKVKMPKVEEKKKLKENVEEKMRFQDLPADPEKYKMVKDSKGKIIKATNADGVEFQRGDVAKAYDGEEIKITDFKEEQGKVKALYNKGMFFATIDIDGLEPGKPTFRPGVNIGGSFEKFKSKLAEMIRQAMDEMYDGRDNLTNLIDDTK